MKKKVLFVATVVKIHIMAFHIPYLEWFKSNGYEVHVAARNDYENSDECNIPFCDKFFDLPFERFPLKKNNFYVEKELKKIIDNNEYELIHCHTPMGGVLGRLAAREARENGTKVIYTAHGFHFYRGAPLINWLVYYSAEKWLAKYTDVLITINQEDYLRASKFEANKIKYVPGIGIDLNKYSELEINREDKRKSIGIASDDFMIISVGELNKNKNHQVVLKAISKLHNEKIKYVLCGEGPIEEDLIGLIKELGIQNQVRILGFRNDVAELYKVADLFVFPSFREGLSLSLMEAMACGLPVVCSNIRGNSDLIEEGQGGYLVDPNDPNIFSEKILVIYNNKDRRRKFATFNLKNINKYSLNNVLKIMGTVYNNEVN